MILKVYVIMNAYLHCIAYCIHPQFRKQSLLTPLIIMTGVVRVLVSKSFRLR